MIGKGLAGRLDTLEAALHVGLAISSLRRATLVHLDDCEDLLARIRAARCELEAIGDELRSKVEEATCR